MPNDVETVIAKMFEDARPRMLTRVQALEAAVEDPAERDRAAIQAHTLIGTLGAFGRLEASNTARDAEEALHRGDLDALASAAAALRAAIEGG